MQETHVPSLGWEDPVEEGMATHSSKFAWRIPWTEKPIRLQSTGLQCLTQLKQLSTVQHFSKHIMYVNQFDPYNNPMD